MKKLYKSRTDVKIAGVCAGIAKYLGVDVTIVRILTIVVMWSGVGLLAYFACAAIMPVEPIENEEEQYTDYHGN